MSSQGDAKLLMGCQGGAGALGGGGANGRKMVCSVLCGGANGIHRECKGLKGFRMGWFGLGEGVMPRKVERSMWNLTVDSGSDRGSDL